MSFGSSISPHKFARMVRTHAVVAMSIPMICCTLAHLTLRRQGSSNTDQVQVVPQADTEHKLSSWMVETWANSPIGQTKEQGAIALEYAAASPDVNGKSAIQGHSVWI